MKNVIKRINNEYYLTTSDGQEFKCSRWYEKKVDKWHILVPKEAREICGRTYIRESYFDHSDIYEFDTKIEHRTGLSAGGWRSKMTDEEKKLVEEAESTIERIKNLCMTREIPKLDPNSIEGIEAQIAKMMAKLEKMKNQ